MILASLALAALTAQPQAANVSWTTGAYAYDGAGNIVSVGPSSDGNTDTYRYDAFGRVAQSTAYTATGPNAQTFSCDPYGNLTVITAGAAAVGNCGTTAIAGYDPAGNQASVTGGASYDTMPSR
ncbi:MAG TPA: RHS repeat domain-containing protein [Thermoanaerobaculia bacterium]|nr:RHS repeat domain-containing protein [Thermoanaerobaculia bacterium]